MTYWIGLGANLGDPVATMGRALNEMDRRGAEVRDVSDVYRTSPVGRRDQPEFANAACTVAFDGPPPALLVILKAIEHDLGRRATERWGPRVIDLDVLLWSGGRWDEPGLVVPHPSLGDRRFALEPLLSIDPDLRMPDGTALSRLVEPLRRDPRQRVDALPDVRLR